MITKRTSRSRRMKVVQLAHGRGLPLPDYQSEGAAGFDLFAAVEASITVKRGARALVPTGLVFELPRGFEAQVRPRSGLALRHGVTVLNSPGTVDSDYRGEVMVLLVNLGEAEFEVRRGDRIAQMVVQRIEQVLIAKAEKASTTARGAGGFGSTGKGTRPARRPAKKKERIVRRP